MEKEILKFTVIDHEEFKKKHKGNYDEYIVKTNNDNKLYTINQLGIIENIKNKNLDFIGRTTKHEGEYIEYTFEGEIEYIPTKIILSVPTKIFILEEYKKQQEIICEYLKEIKTTLKIRKQRQTKQNLEMFKYIRNIIIASGISVGILLATKNKEKKEEPEIKPKVVYETPEKKEEQNLKDIIKTLRI